MKMIMVMVKIEIMLNNIIYLVLPAGNFRNEKKKKDLKTFLK